MDGQPPRWRIRVFSLSFLLGSALGQIHYSSILTGRKGEAGLQDGDQENTLFNFPSALCGVYGSTASSCVDCTLVRV